MSTLTEKQEFRALVVDDDSIVIRMVSFALQQEGFVCDTAVDGEQALGLLDRQSYDLVVTDLQMPNKHGHALAVQVLAGETRPRIMVHTSIDDPRMTKDLMIRGVDDVVYKPTNYAAFAAKAKGLVIRDSMKPKPEIKADQDAEENGCSESETQDEAESQAHEPVALPELKRTLSDVSKVLPVSHAALDVANMTESGSFDAERVAATIQRDPSVAAKVLQLANDPFYNATGKQVTDLKQAVTRIGQKRVGELALASSAFASITTEVLPWMDVDLAWRQSLAAGIAVELLIAEGKHARISEGLLFSALMHSSGRVVLGTHYPKKYDAMVKRCAEDNETLLKHEQRVFPENHAQVICDLLADWNIPTEVYQPLKHVLNDYPSLANLPEPMRTKVELVKLAILIGRIAVGRWEAWDLVELPPRQVLDRLGIDAVGTIIEQTEAQLPGIANFRTCSNRNAAKDAHPRLVSRELTYCNLSEEPFDFLAKIVPSMGIRLNSAKFKIGKSEGRVLVNRIGATPNQSAVQKFKKYDLVVFVRDAAKMKYITSERTNVAVPCSYAALRSACWEVAIA